VDDETVIRLLISAALVRAGYHVDAVPDGAAAWAALQGKHYDLLVTDNSMPKITGIGLIKMLRSQASTLPVVMATGAIPTEDLKRHPWLRINAILVKPYTIEDLLEAVKKTFQEADSIASHCQLLLYLNTHNTKLLLGAEAECAPTLPPRNSGRRILVVERDGDLRQMYADALVGSDCNLDFAEDGIAAWEALQMKQYNLLITENDVPNLTGVELVHKLRSARMDLPVVMAAGRLPVHELARNPALQLVTTLEKPFVLDAFLATVQNALHGPVPAEMSQLSLPLAPSDQLATQEPTLKL
jgi:CheY-like chemotaxis protein